MSDANTSDAPLRVRPADLILRPFREFARFQASGGILLVAAAVVALVWANSSWSESYRSFWQGTELSIGTPAHMLTMPLVTWINDLAMAVFFLLVGVEIKREIVAGELSSLRKAALPIIAAVGGMVVPGLIYVVANAGRGSVQGWGIPVATDIAFALGVLLLLGPRVPVTLKVFLVSLAIADDIGALLVIAIFYTEQLNLTFLAAAGGAVAFLLLLNYLGFRSPAPFMLVGLVIWWLVHESGIHATIAGVATAMTIPARAQIKLSAFTEAGRRSLALLENETDDSGTVITRPSILGAVHVIDRACRDIETPLQRVEHGLHSWVAFFILPLFALANAGVDLRGSLSSAVTSPVAVGVVLGLLLGKPLGIYLFAWFGVRSGMAILPAGVGWRHVVGASFLGGIGFTMSLFIAHLAFDDAQRIAEAKIAILGASLLAGVAGWCILRGAKSLDATAAEGKPDAEGH